MNHLSRAPASDTGAAWISALADGDPEAAERGCALWREDAQARATWHAYHLIGDVMRSDDLACTPARDAAFLAALRTRLAAEPVVLAPEPAVAPVRRRQGWMVPAAVAAGFAAVAGVMVVARVAPTADAPLVAVGRAPADGVQPATAAPPRPAPQFVVQGALIRDPRLDAYLDAHRQVAGSPTVAFPGGVPRSVGPLAPMALVPVEVVAPAAPQAASR